MKEQLIHVINKIILPKYPEIIDFSIDIRKVFGAVYYDVRYIFPSAEHDTIYLTKISKDTKSLFNMLSPLSDEAVFSYFYIDTKPKEKK